MTKCELESDSDNTHAKEDEGKTTRTKPYRQPKNSESRRNCLL